MCRGSRGSRHAKAVVWSAVAACESGGNCMWSEQKNGSEV
jgi:hypothetical protein